MNRHPLTDKILKILKDDPMTEIKLETILFKWQLSFDERQCILDLFREMPHDPKVISPHALKLLENQDVDKICENYKNGIYEVFVKPKNTKGIIDIGIQTQTMAGSSFPLGVYPVITQYWMTDKKAQKE